MSTQMRDDGDGHAEGNGVGGEWRGALADALEYRHLAEGRKVVDARIGARVGREHQSAQ